MTAGLWAAKPPTMALRAPTIRNTLISSASEGERTLDAVQALLQRLGGEPARPGVRPQFIPAAAIVVRAGVPAEVGLATALSSRAGSVVAWVR